MSRLLASSLIALALALVIACNGIEEELPTPPGVRETPESTPRATPGRTGGQAEARIDWLVAQNSEFKREGTDQVVERITIPANSDITIEFTNLDPLPHNFAAYETSAADRPIFVGETFSGPNETRTYQFRSPERPGAYFFRCDVHPNTMTGELVVQ